MAGTPQVAVCVPVAASSDPLTQLLAAIRRQSWPADLLRVVISLDGPNDELAESARSSGADVVVSDPAAGPAHARNVAIDRASEAQIIVFTDADCVPHPDWIRNHVRALDDADMSGGAVTVRLSADRAPAEYLDRRRHLRQENYVRYEGFAATANLAVRQEVARLHFDEHLTLAADEDVDFCHRARAAGYSLVYTPDALVDHPARNRREFIAKIRRMSSAIRLRAARDVLLPTARLPSIRLLVGTIRAARRQGESRGVAWDLELAALVAFTELTIWRAVRHARRAREKLARGQVDRKSTND